LTTVIFKNVGGQEKARFSARNGAMTSFLVYTLDPEEEIIGIYGTKDIDPNG
jgi:hypothetical protein